MKKKSNTNQLPQTALPQQTLVALVNIRMQALDSLLIVLEYPISKENKHNEKEITMTIAQNNKI